MIRLIETESNDKREKKEDKLNTILILSLFIFPLRRFNNAQHIYNYIIYMYCYTYDNVSENSYIQNKEVIKTCKNVGA